MKNTPMYVRHKIAFVVLLSTECRRIYSYINSSPTIIILENVLVYRKSLVMVMVTVTTGMMTYLFACTYFWCGEFYEGGPCMRWPPVKWSATAESVRNTGLCSNWSFYVLWSIHFRGNLFGK
jgi:hypothetical protein